VPNGRTPACQRPFRKKIGIPCKGKISVKELSAAFKPTAKPNNMKMSFSPRGVSASFAETEEAPSGSSGSPSPTPKKTDSLDFWAQFSYRYV